LPAITSAVVRSIFAGRPLPPGDYLPLDVAERGNRLLLLERSRQIGQVFKGLTENRVVICVTDASQARQLLKDHAADLVPVSIDLRRLDPAGFMRQMQGETHRCYRRDLIDALKSVQSASQTGVFEAITLDALEAFALEPPAGDSAWSKALSRIATGMLVHAVFGAAPGSSSYQRLLHLYGLLGPTGVAWTIGPRQIEAFDALRSEIAGLPRTNGVCAELAGRGTLDATMLANLIYMVELGRYDMRGLFRWISKFAAQHPGHYEEAANEGEDRSASEAFVSEVLRLEQSERLMRNVLRSFVWNGMLIPKGALLRICMWEEHKRPDLFEDPFAFRPDRFRNATRPSFSPFGLDHHRCPFASLTMLMGSVFLRTMARNFRISASGGEPPVRGPYHWEPAPGFSVELTPCGRIS
jgi:cytochrome P450